MLKYTKIDLGLGLLFALALGYAGGRYLQPARIEERVVEKEVVRREVRVIEREKKLPDGTTEKEKIVEEIAQEEKQSDKERALEQFRPKWRASVLAAYEREHGRSLGAQVQYRFLGPIFVSGFVMDSGTAGVGLGMEF